MEDDCEYCLHAMACCLHAVACCEGVCPRVPAAAGDSETLDKFSMRRIQTHRWFRRTQLSFRVEWEEEGSTPKFVSCEVFSGSPRLSLLLFEYVATLLPVERGRVVCALDETAIYGFGEMSVSLPERFERTYLSWARWHGEGVQSVVMACLLASRRVCCAVGRRCGRAHHAGCRCPFGAWRRGPFCRGRRCRRVPGCCDA